VRTKIAICIIFSSVLCVSLCPDLFAKSSKTKSSADSQSVSEVKSATDDKESSAGKKTSSDDKKDDDKSASDSDKANTDKDSTNKSNKTTKSTSKTAKDDDDDDASLKAKKSFSGNVSWYGVPFHGRKTASGEVFDMNKLSAAHLKLPLPSRALVEDPRSGNAVIVRVNDRGPYCKSRVMDLSREAGRKLGILSRGVGYADITVLERKTK
jgi:rare lipoprotein A